MRGGMCRDGWALTPLHPFTQTAVDEAIENLKNMKLDLDEKLKVRACAARRPRLCPALAAKKTHLRPSPLLF